MSTGVTNSCKLPCECWELNLSPLVEQPVLLITKPFPSYFPFLYKLSLFVSLYMYMLSLSCLHGVCSYVCRDAHIPMESTRGKLESVFLYLR